MKSALHGLLAGLAIALAGVATAQVQQNEPVTSIAFVGDIMLADTPGKVVKSGRDPFAPMASILNTADVRVGNLESLIATIGTPVPDKPYTFRAHPRTLPLLKRHFDALALANNHSGDYGPLAFNEMLGLLERTGIPYFGGGRTLTEAHRPLIIERQGMRIALLSYNEFFPRSFEADTGKPGIAWSEDEQVRLDIATARTTYRADLVIPFMHWGWEHERTASQRQRQLARLMVDAGADAVVGGHPHVTQDIEQYRGKPIFYSLGNFVFDSFSDAANNTGWVLRMELDHQGVRAWRIVATRIDREGTPHPAPRLGQTCWVRGQDEAQPCGRH